MPSSQDMSPLSVLCSNFALALSHRPLDLISSASVCLVASMLCHLSARFDSPPLMACVLLRIPSPRHCNRSSGTFTSPIGTKRRQRIGTSGTGAVYAVRRAYALKLALMSEIQPRLDFQHNVTHRPPLAAVRRSKVTSGPSQSVSGAHPRQSGYGSTSLLSARHSLSASVQSQDERETRPPWALER